MEPWTDGVPVILNSELLFQPHERMEPGSDGDFNIRTLTSPGTQKMQPETNGGTSDIETRTPISP